jgi:hypothetical protein
LPPITLLLGNVGLSLDIRPAAACLIALSQSARNSAPISLCSNSLRRLSKRFLCCLDAKDVVLTCDRYG